MNTSIKTYIMQASASNGKRKVLIQALSVAEAKQIAYDLHGIEFYFKGYQS